MPRPYSHSTMTTHYDWASYLPSFARRCLSGSAQRKSSNSSATLPYPFLTITGTVQLLTMPAPSLPHVVWDRIAHYLSEDPATLLQVAALSADLTDICRPHISAVFETIEHPPAFLPRTMFYHRILQFIFENLLDPTAICEFFSYDSRRYSGQEGDPIDPDSALLLLDTLPGRSWSEERLREFEQFVQELINSSPFIPDELKVDISARFRCGDPDAALAVMLPLCPKLKTLEIPEDSDLCGRMVQSIAREYRRRGVDPEYARKQAWQAAQRDRNLGSTRRLRAQSELPFSEVLILCVRDPQWNMRNFALSEMTAFMGLPSLHRIVLESLCESRFPGWPTDHVECSCPAVYFQLSALTRRAARRFAQGMTGPCEIRQWYFYNLRFAEEKEEQGQLRWDTTRVSSRADGGREVRMSVEHEGGNPGCEHPWVSWLWHGKMLEWRRLDEAFDVEPGDEHESLTFLNGAV